MMQHDPTLVQDQLYLLAEGTLLLEIGYADLNSQGQGVGSSEQGARRICPIGGRTHAVIIPSGEGIVVSLDVGTMNFLARSFGTCSLGLEEFCCELRCRNKM